MRLIVRRTFSRRRGDGSTVTYRRGEHITVSELAAPTLQLIKEGYLVRENKKRKNNQEADPNGKEKRA